MPFESMLEAEKIIQKSLNNLFLKDLKAGKLESRLKLRGYDSDETGKLQA